MTEQCGQLSHNFATGIYLIGSSFIGGPPVKVARVVRAVQGVRAMRGASAIPKLIPQRAVSVNLLAERKLVRGPQNVTGGQIISRPTIRGTGGNKPPPPPPRTVADILRGKTETTRQVGRARNFEGSGGFNQALKDFNSMQPSNVKPINTRYGSGRVGFLPDGTKVTVRPGSSTGGATLEIKQPGFREIKIRY